MSISIQPDMKRTSTGAFAEVVPDTFFTEKRPYTNSEFSLLK